MTFAKNHLLMFDDSSLCCFQIHTNNTINTSVLISDVYKVIRTLLYARGFQYYSICDEELKTDEGKVLRFRCPVKRVFK